MAPNMITSLLIILQLTIGVITTSFTCPTQCTCKEENIIECKNLENLQFGENLNHPRVRRIPRAAKQPLNPQTSQKTVAGNSSGNKSNQNVPDDHEHTSNLPTVIVAIISVLALVVNIGVKIKLCIKKRTVMDLFAISLMIFNIVIGLYGIGMVLYLRYPFLKEAVWYCQFFTSIKLFGLGSSVYAMLFLIFYRSIENSIEVESDDKENIEKKRQAIFKSIAYVLQAITLSGLLGVLSWIKLKDWNHLCIILEPSNSVEKILMYIEVFYYIIAGSLVTWYLMELIYPRCKIAAKKHLNMVKALFLDEKKKDELLTPYIIREEAYISRDLPVFFLVACSFAIWIAGYAMTLPEMKYFEPSTAAVIRVCSVLLPVVLQPLLYLMTPMYTLKRSSSRRENTSRVSEVKLECEQCSWLYTCPNCTKEMEKNNENVQLATLDANENNTTTHGKDENIKEKSAAENNATVVNNGTHTTNNDVPISDNPSEVNPEETEKEQLLTEHDERRKKLQKVPKIDVSCATPPPASPEEKEKLLAS